ncbi:hypothetical protein CDD82_922 [Ophiocordyceps australis]|uniref:AAA+ ATPase domain-containing protein n=1 Tax=Ophiocordyceps australis TaxID=1399860 RepID=A0A2C5XD37_9HYPO|nr:hypothetical protein CDD82_922 [Ophiocordyceps australis]
MMRNKAFSLLQKTYDDSYLSCSTAVYYESQGNEAEAMRHWRCALNNIYEHQATKATPGYEPLTDTERALTDALKRLELQCKERIDLLQALHASRKNDVATKPSKSDKDIGVATGSIGQGTIPAVSYSELSRPSLPQRPSLPPRTYSETTSHNVETNSPATGTLDSSSPQLPPRREKSARSPSPEKHTMRTTLRSGKTPTEKSSKLSRKSSKQPAAEGSSKAATLAWTALGARERLAKATSATSDGGSIASILPMRRSSEQLAKVPLQWDSHSRRLVSPREPGTYLTNPARSSSTPRNSDEYPSYTRPSLLSVSAASSALSSSSVDAVPGRSDLGPSRRVTPAQTTTPSRSAKGDDAAKCSGVAGDTSGLSTKKPPDKFTGAKVKATARKPLPTPPTYSAVSPRNPENISRVRRRVRQEAQQASGSSASENDMVASSSKLQPASVLEAPMKMDESDASFEGSASNDCPTLNFDPSSAAWANKKKSILRNLPPGVDDTAAKQILNDIVVEGDEVHWTDIAGLEIAKNALRETVVYPFLRPDLFMGLREPARGMLLFGPPGTGKTMLARAVATESKSTFFSISASSLTSKFLGESEKLVKALFALARALAPSIIFVDEIDSLLSQRSGTGEHEATRRIKTEFLIQWSDLQRAAAGRETTDKDRERGDANRVLVLAATNLPWAIDEAARRRFVRRQYIPLPEAGTRETQLRTLLGQQKHNLSGEDIKRLNDLTEGFSGSDITALAKDAAMGPLRSLGEALLHMTMDDIRPITLADFETSLGTIRPSVSKAGLKEYEDWAKEFGERGG